MHSFVASSLDRLVEARQIADETRDHEALHRLAMKAVFILEDMYETFVRLAEDRAADQARRSSASTLRQGGP